MASEEPQLPTEEELSKLTREAQIVYAARAALRVYPLLGHLGHLNFFGRESVHHPISIFTAILAVMLDRKVENASAQIDEALKKSNADSVKSAMSGDFKDPPNISAIRVIMVVRAVVDLRSIADHKGKIVHAHIAADIASDLVLNLVDYDSYRRFIQISSDDYQLLTKTSDYYALYETPLFSDKTYIYSQELLDKCLKAFRKSQTEVIFSEWLEFYAGKPREREKYENWIDKWLGEEGVLHNSYCSTAADHLPERDLLGRDALVTSLREMLSRKEQQTPLTLALFGDWGAGKSSVMHLLQKELAEQEDRAHVPFLFSWFNCWEYEQTECIRSGLAQEVVRGLLSNGKFSEDEQKRVREVWPLQKEWIRSRYLLTAKWKELLSLSGYFIVLLFIGFLGALPFIFPLLKDWLSSLDWMEFIVSGMETVQSRLKPYAPYIKALGTGMVGLSLIKSWDLFKKFYQFMNHPLTVRLATFYKLPSYLKQLGQIPEMRKQLYYLCRVRLYSIWNVWRGLGNRLLNVCRRVPGVLNWMCFKWSPFKEFEVNQWKPQPNKRLLVFVDDLDRCKRDKIAEVFDAIRLITHIPGVIVMVAIDERIAFKAMGEAYRAFADPSRNRSKEDVARDYLGKIIQVPITLQKPESDKLDGYIDDALFPVGMRKQEEGKPPEGGGGESGGNVNSYRLSEGTEFSDTILSGPRLEPQLALTPVRMINHEALKMSNQEVREFKELVKLFQFNNPRQLLRLSNSYRFLRTLVESGEGSEFKTADEGHTDYYRIMLMLFWLEYRMEHPMKEVKKVRDDLSNNTDLGEAENSFFRAMTEEEFRQAAKDSDFPDNPKLDYDKLELFTKNYVLPYPDKKQPHQKEEKAKA